MNMVKTVNGMNVITRTVMHLTFMVSWNVLLYSATSEHPL